MPDNYQNNITTLAKRLKPFLMGWMANYIEGNTLELDKIWLFHVEGGVTLYDRDASGLQSAVAAASSGDKIVVPAGEFYASFTVPASVQIFGMGTDRTIIYGVVTGSSEGSIQDLYIINPYPYAGVGPSTGKFTVNDCLVTSCHGSGFHQPAGGETFIHHSILIGEEGYAAVNAGTLTVHHSGVYGSEDWFDGDVEVYSITEVDPLCTSLECLEDMAAAPNGPYDMGLSGTILSDLSVEELNTIFNASVRNSAATYQTAIDVTACWQKFENGEWVEDLSNEGWGAGWQSGTVLTREATLVEPDPIEECQTRTAVFDSGTAIVSDGDDGPVVWIDEAILNPTSDQTLGVVAFSPEEWVYGGTAVTVECSVDTTNDKPGLSMIVVDAVTDVEYRIYWELDVDVEWTSMGGVQISSSITDDDYGEQFEDIFNSDDNSGEYYHEYSGYYDAIKRGGYDIGPRCYVDVYTIFGTVRASIRFVASMVPIGSNLPEKRLVISKIEVRNIC